MDFNVLMFVPTICSILALCFAAFSAHKVLREDEGNETVKEIALAIRTGANAYLKRQYRGIAIFFVVMFCILLALSFTGFLSIFVAFTFLSGGLFSGLSGFIGMKIATAANSRTATAATHSLNKALRVAFSSGTVMGMTVVGLALFDVGNWFFFLNWFFGGLPDAEKIVKITTILLTYGIGASSMALFARVGGGIFTKAADVGADLVGKVEIGIPEDDPRNPAVIADNVGDNVGDVAGMGADLYESYVGSIVSSATLAVAAGFGQKGMMLPLYLAGLGILASIIGTFFVRTNENATQRSLLGALRRGTYLSAAIIVVGSYFLVTGVLGQENIGIYLAVLCGLVAGVGIGYFTEYFTSDTYKPTQGLAKTSLTGAATVIIGGLSLGMLSTVVPVVIVSISVMASFLLAGGAASYNAGLFGIGISAVGMLSTLGITLATDAYGPVADNAGGIAEMAGLEEVVRERTDALDSLGNTTAATGKGFAIGSAALTALALIVSFQQQVQVTATSMGIPDVFNLSILNPPVLVGLFLGGMLPFVFVSLTMNSVGKAAQLIVVEVRRQFKEIVGLMEGTAKPDYAACVDICTRNAQKQMVLPALLAIISPVAVGLVLGVNGVAGFLAGTTVTGFIMAVMLANAGGAWDNAKKYIEAGNFGGKGSDAHKAAVVGDTVGDPFKDTSGPSINILIKLSAVVAIVFGAFILTFSIM